MAYSHWKKIENDAGYPFYVDDTTGKQSSDHPEFKTIMDNIKQYDNIKYSIYRVAFKIFELQKQLRVPPLRICSGVFSRHQLSLSESSLSLDPPELEAVLADIYFAAEKEGLYTGDVDLAVDLVINLLLNVYDSERKQSIRVLAAKALLIILSEETVLDKWQFLANCAADHNGCVSPKRLSTLLSYVTALCRYLEGICSDNLQEDVEACFAKSAGMLGVSTRSVAEWAVSGCASAKFLAVLSRIQYSRTQATVAGNCALCSKPIVQMLKFKCSKCSDVFLCEKCYLYDEDLSALTVHKKTHVVQEIIDNETNPSECLSFIRTVKRIFFCAKPTKKKKAKKNRRISDKDKENKVIVPVKNSKPAIFTSTVGKASGNSNKNNPAVMLQDIIAQLESQNKALRDLSEALQSAGNTDDCLKGKVDTHWNQISTQINRLKILQENISYTPHTTDPAKTKQEQIKVFDLLSPIQQIEDDQQPKSLEHLKNQPRVLSLDSGNFSVTSKRQDSQNLMTVSGDDLKPIVVHATSDSISTVSMNDISCWYNEESKVPEQLSSTKPPDAISQSLCASERQFDADLRSVASSNNKMKELNAGLDTVLDRLQQILTNNFAMDDSRIDNNQLRETANEMEGLLGTLIRGVEERATLNASKNLV